MIKDKSSKENKSKQCRHIRRLICAVCIIAVAVLVISGLDFSDLEVTYYKVDSEKISGNIRIVFLSDLHLREFGEKNIDLLKKTEELKPDIIAVTGDLTIYGNEDHEVAVALLNDLSEIAPTYYSYGNHEYTEILFTQGSTLAGDLKATHAVVLNKKYETVKINGSEINIGGFCIGPQNMNDQHIKFLNEFCGLEGFNLLLCHHVECFEDAMKDYPVDLALTGHAHGGQVRIPFVGGLYSPEQGFFPKLTAGMSELCGSTVVISRGLGNSTNVPRFNNDPEVIVIDIEAI